MNAGHIYSRPARLTLVRVTSENTPPGVSVGSAGRARGERPATRLRLIPTTG